MQEDNHIFQGLRRDNHQIRQDAKFLWDAHNIRLTNRDDSTLLSLTNERGTSDKLITFQGHYVGHCVLGKYLVVFTSNDDGSDNYIYRIEKVENNYKTIILFHKGDVWDHCWKPSNPIEAIGVYETELVQKVYWVDGVNQPRMINIAKPELKLPKYIDIGNNEKQELLIDGVNLSGPNYSQDPNVDQYLFYNIPNGLYLKESFDFVRTLELNERVTVSKNYGQGQFSPGTIQYAISYYDKYGQESNICYTTPLFYVSPPDRGGSPEEKVANSFHLTIYNPDNHFDYVRIYSIHRTSIDAVPTVKVVGDIAVIHSSTDPLEFVDTGTTGYTVDPSQLLFIGGRSIVASTLAKKDNTLFLGNLTVESDPDISEIEALIKSNFELVPYSYPSAFSNSSSSGGVYYKYLPNLSNRYPAVFKAGEFYRCGIQVQMRDGTWCKPIFIKDCIVSEPPTLAKDESSFIYTKAIRLNNSEQFIKNLESLGVKNIRTCVVFPKLYERSIICQGVLCPTVYSLPGRRDNSPFAMSSWFFRPAVDLAPNLDAVENKYNISKGAQIQFQHDRPLFAGPSRGAEIQSMKVDSSISMASDITADKASDYSSYFFVDENLVTFHSPDLEFDPNIGSLNWDGVELNIIGVAKLGAIYGDTDVQTSTTVVSNKAKGFVHRTVGYSTAEPKLINGGFVSNTEFNDGFVKADTYESAELSGIWWMVYPWHRSGSLNNDSNRPTDKGSRSAVLLKKKISNLKFFNKNLPLDDDTKLLNYKISTPALFNSNEISLLKIKAPSSDTMVTYLGNVDTVALGDDYPLYLGWSFDDLDVKSCADDTRLTNPIATSSDPVRIKYKSTPHLVFSLKGENPGEIPLLPRHSAITGVLNGSYTVPGWQYTAKTNSFNYDAELGAYSYSSGDFSYENGVFLEGKYVARLGTYDDGESLGHSLWICRNQKLLLANNSPTGSDIGKILKVSARNTIIGSSRARLLLPGTTESDYQGNLYIGKDRYYKIVSDPNVKPPISPRYWIALKEVTPPSNSSTEEDSGSISYTVSQYTFGDRDDRGGAYSYLLLGELINNNVENRFGGNSEQAREENLWLPASDPVHISSEALENEEGIEDIPYLFGDTWYSRYDCLKTYPFTQEDENQVIEIGSFMCETRVNIDGRYDRNRGQLSNLNMTPQNFNLMNEVYTQKDNFFNYRILDEDYYRQNTFANQVTWSKEKSAGEEIDTWTNITLANTLDMDGEKGKVTALRAWNEYLLCFQERALSQILFNSRVQIPTTDGVPIEISNGYKVDDSRLLSGNIGCTNKWAISPTSQGVYFLDSNTDSIYLFNGQLGNLSEDRGMDWWVRQNHTDKVWCPIDYGENLNGVRAFYDNKYGDMYFTPGPTLLNQPDALCYSEQLGQFTSLMSYGGTQAMLNFADGFYSLRHDSNGNLSLYQNNVGDYNNFYGTTKGWSFSFISNQNPTLTKIFDTIDLRTDHYWTYGKEQLLNSCPMNFIEVDNEYQHSDTVLLDNKNMRKKFRVWRGLIPRNKGTRQRIRNPWSMITLGWTPINTEQPGDNTKKAVVHDVSVKYTV